MKQLRLILMTAGQILFASFSVASPIIPQAGITIEGCIDEILWIPDKHLEGESGMSGSAGIARVVPAHYAIRLIDTTISSREYGATPLKSGEAAEIKINHPKKDGYLKKGMNIRVIDYLVMGDEGGVWTSFARIEMLDKQQGCVKK